MSGSAQWRSPPKLNFIVVLPWNECLFALEPRITGRIFPRIVWIKVDEAALYLPIANLEDVAPAAGAVLGSTGAPLSIAMLAFAGAFAHDKVAAREDVVVLRIVVQDGFQRAADISE